MKRGQIYMPYKISVTLIEYTTGKKNRTLDLQLWLIVPASSFTWGTFTSRSIGDVPETKEP